MRQTILMLLLAAAAGSALADWVKLAAAGNAANTIYADPATIRKAGNKAKLWTLVDHQTALSDSFGKAHASEKVQWEYDCKDDQQRMLAYVTFAENMGKGKTVFSDPDPGKWSPVAADTAEKALWKIACGKK